MTFSPFFSPFPAKRTLLDVLPGEVFVADNLAFAVELFGVGDGLDPLNGDFNADAIGGPAILDDLVNQAAR